MKYLFLALAIASSAAIARDNFVAPHIRKDGTFVEGHYRSNPNSNRFDNYSTQGNVNPYTGQQGRVDPYQQPIQPVQPHYPQRQSGYQNPYGR